MNSTNERIERLGLKKSFIAKQLGISKCYVTGLCNGSINNYDKMTRLKQFLTVYEKELKENCILSCGL